MSKPLTVWILTNCGRSYGDGNTRPSYLSPRNLYVGQQATDRTLYGTTDWFKVEKGVWWGHTVPCTENTRRNAKLDSATSWNQDCWEKYQQPQICGWYHSNGRKQRGTKEPLGEGGRGEWKNQLKTQYQKQNKTKTMASAPITSWWTEGEKVEAVTDFLSRALKSLRMMAVAMKLKDDCFLKGKLWQT